MNLANQRLVVIAMVNQMFDLAEREDPGAPMLHASQPDQEVAVLVLRHGGCKGVILDVVDALTEIASESFGDLVTVHGDPDIKEADLGIGPEPGVN